MSLPVDEVKVDRSFLHALRDDLEVVLCFPS
jgi:sensor c-di-GMP phosphodiesterase-like protein